MRWRTPVLQRLRDWDATNTTHLFVYLLIKCPLRAYYGSVILRSEHKFFIFCDGRRRSRTTKEIHDNLTFEQHTFTKNSHSSLQQLASLVYDFCVISLTKHLLDENSKRKMWDSDWVSIQQKIKNSQNNTLANWKLNCAYWEQRIATNNNRAPFATFNICESVACERATQQMINEHDENTCRCVKLNTRYHQERVAEKELVLTYLVAELIRPSYKKRTMWS